MANRASGQLAGRQARGSSAAERSSVTAVIAALTVATWTTCLVLTLNAPEVGQVAQRWLSNSPRQVVEHLWLWQLVTANFLHLGIFHLGVNLFFVLWLGPPLEELLGGRRFLFLYLGAGIFTYASFDLGVGAFWGGGQTAGASGSVLALIALYALCFPRRSIYFFGVVEFPFYWLLVLFIVSDLSSLLLGDGIPGVNSVVHLGGVAFGCAFWLLIVRSVHTATPNAIRTAAGPLPRIAQR